MVSKGYPWLTMANHGPLNSDNCQYFIDLFLYLSTPVGSFASGSVRFFIILREASFQSIKGLELSWAFFSVQLVASVIHYWTCLSDDKILLSKVFLFLTFCYFLPGPWTMIHGPWTIAMSGPWTMAIAMAMTMFYGPWPWPWSMVHGHGHGP